MTCPIAELVGLYNANCNVFDSHPYIENNTWTIDNCDPSIVCVRALTWRLRWYMTILDMCLYNKRTLVYYLKWAMDTHVPLVRALQQNIISNMCDIYRKQLDPRQQPEFPIHAINMDRFAFDLEQAWTTNMKISREFTREVLLSLVCPHRRTTRQIYKMLLTHLTSKPCHDTSLFFVDIVKIFVLGNYYGRTGPSDFNARLDIYGWDLKHVCSVCVDFATSQLVDFALYELFIESLNRQPVMRNFIASQININALEAAVKSAANQYVGPAILHRVLPSKAVRNVLARHLTLKPIATIMPPVLDAHRRVTLTTLPVATALLQYKIIQEKLNGQLQLAQSAFCVVCATLRVNPIGCTSSKKTDFMHLMGDTAQMVCDKCHTAMIYVDLIGRVLYSRIMHHEPNGYVRTTLCTECAALCVMQPPTVFDGDRIVCANCVDVRASRKLPRRCFKGCPLDRHKDVDCAFYAYADTGRIQLYHYCHRHLVKTAALCVPTIQALHCM